MPIFDYTCQSCEYEFEKLCMTRSEEEVECPECGEVAEREEKIYGDHMIKYKGEGFHRTDYENKDTQ